MSPIQFPSAAGRVFIIDPVRSSNSSELSFALAPSIALLAVYLPVEQRISTGSRKSEPGQGRTLLPEAGHDSSASKDALRRELKSAREALSNAKIRPRPTPSCARSVNSPS